MRPVLVTSGDPAGIGPDLCIHLLNSRELTQPLVVMGDRNMLRERARLLGAPCTAGEYPAAHGRAIWHCPLPTPAVPGQLQTAHVPYVLDQLRQGAHACLQGTFCAQVTAPVSKAIILAAGYSFTGQTEFIADCVNADCPVMVLASPRLRVALATTHLPLRLVADALRTDRLYTQLSILHRDLPRLSSANPPVIKVCGLNPHAGEGGYLGDEEQSIIAPAIAHARSNGMNVSGPYAADTLLGQAQLPAVDCVLAMYHDQGLPAIKALDFSTAVNVTLGLPFLRTSPGHGVALDKAGKGGIDTGSMKASLSLALSARLYKR